jgi:hypothetical protein
MDMGVGDSRGLVSLATGIKTEKDPLLVDYLAKKSK